MFHFLVDKKTLTLAVAVLGLMAVLVFSGGLLLGLHLNLESRVVDPDSATAFPVLPRSSAAASSITRTVSGTAAPAATPVLPEDDNSATSEPEPPAAPPSSAAGAPAAAAPSIPAPEETPEETPEQDSVPAPATPPPAVVSVSVSPSAPEASAEPEPATEPQTEPEPEAEPSLPAAPDASIGESDPAPAVPAATEPAPPAPRSGSSFSIQVGAYRSEEYLEEELRRLRAAGYEPYVVAVETRHHGTLRTIRLGPFGSRDAARAAAFAFESREGVAPEVRSP